MKRALIILGICGLFVVLIWKSTRPQTGRLTGSAMGLTWHLEWRGKSPPPEKLQREVAATLEHWEQVMSKWRENSDASRFNRGEPVTPDLARVIALADAVRIESGGAFDHRLLESVHAAGFGPAGKGIDLSAIGEGFAVDRVAEKLRQLGVTDFIFELGGEVIAGDGDWPVEIEKPDPAARVIFRKVILRNQALATSGNYRQFLPSSDGMKTHLIDPKTGQPVVRPPSSVTVIANDCATADAWATAIFVTGPSAKFPTGLEVHWQP